MLQTEVLPEAEVLQAKVLQAEVLVVLEVVLQEELLQEADLLPSPGSLLCQEVVLQGFEVLR
ncbi:MAG: hypothetical protein K8U03_15545 [Planctomycetia bacterium]|nr:hypothetical protein [Planctomycetia bacterium]